MICGTEVTLGWVECPVRANQERHLNEMGVVGLEAQEFRSFMVGSYFGGLQAVRCCMDRVSVGE